MINTELYEAVGTEYVPMERWGKDHWSTFAYLETVSVDKHGQVERSRMRCNARLHRTLANIVPHFNEIVDGSPYPTRLKDGELEGHDDWSCAEDMVAAGLIEMTCGMTHPGRSFGSHEAQVRLTPKGTEVANQLRNHKREGGQFASFTPAL